MTYLSTILIMAFLSCHAFSAPSTITSQIHEIDMGTTMGDEVLVYLKSGEVLRLLSSDIKKVDQLRKASSNNHFVKLSIDDQRFIKKFTRSEMRAKPLALTENILENFEEEYVPTTVANMGLVKSYIAEGKHPTKELTQCFNRAMVWSYEWWRNHSLKTNKVFIFWPKAYVRKYSFKWWFHVAPYAHVMDSDGVVKERVMDVKWLDRPYQLQDWADYHSSNDVKCKVVQKYSDYADYPFKTDRCYFIKSNMFTWQPADLEMKEAWGYTKNAFNMDEIRAAYLEAFDIKL